LFINGENVKKNKKGIELSINFLVVIIMGIVILMGGIALIVKMMSGADKIHMDLDRQTKEQIESLLLDGSKVAVPINTKEIRIGKNDLFGVGVYNVLPETDFKIKITFSNSYNEKTQEPLNTNGNYVLLEWVLYNEQSKTIKKNEFEFFSIYINPIGTSDTNLRTEPGIYIFNVNVTYDESGTWKMYDGHIHKIYVRVR
jgi:hypothetical protein